MSDRTYLLTEAELTRLMAACWQSGKTNELPFALGDDGERIVLGAVVVANRDGYADLATRRDVLRQVIAQAFTRDKEFRDGMQQLRDNPFADLVLTLFGGIKQ